MSHHLHHKWRWYIYAMSSHSVDPGWGFCSFCPQSQQSRRDGIFNVSRGRFPSHFPIPKLWRPEPKTLKCHKYNSIQCSMWWKWRCLQVCTAWVVSIRNVLMMYCSFSSLFLVSADDCRNARCITNPCHFVPNPISWAITLAEVRAVSLSHFKWTYVIKANTS